MLTFNLRLAELFPFYSLLSNGGLADYLSYVLEHGDRRPFEALAIINEYKRRHGHRPVSVLQNSTELSDAHSQEPNSGMQGASAEGQGSLQLQGDPCLPTGGRTGTNAALRS